MSKSPKKNGNVTIYDVAREAGVSYATVSRVFNGADYVKDSTRNIVLDVAKRLGYVANQSARSLAGGKSNVIGLLVPGLDSGYIGEIARGIDLELAHYNFNLMVYTTHRNAGQESDFAGMIADGISAGMLLIVPLIPTRYLESLRERQYPYVLIDQDDASTKSDIVDSTNYQGAYEAVKHFLDLGHRRIAHIAGLERLSSSQQRIDGYKHALKDYQVALCEEYLVAGDYWERGGYNATLELLDLPKRPTAIFAANDLTAFGAMTAIRERGLSIPEDISIIGFDDVPQALITHPKLTTVRQSLEEMGRVAVRLLLEKIENPERPPRRISLATELIIRDSCQSIESHD